MQTDGESATEAQAQQSLCAPDADVPMVVGIGGSAGALGALMVLLQSLGEVPLAIVVVLHLDPDHESNAVEILQRMTPLSVMQVRSRTPLTAGHVYVIAPGMNLITEDGHVQPGEGEPRRPSAVIDLFFRSLAEVHRDRAEIATVFVDPGMRVKRFTPQASKLFHLIPSDVGRPLMDVKSRLQYDGIVEDATTVFKQLVPVERSVKSNDGEHYFARIVPYRTAQDRIGGAVLTFINVTELRRAEDRVRLTEERLRDAIATSKDFAVMSIDMDGHITTWNDGAARIFGYPPPDIVGQPIDVLFAPEDRRGGLGIGLSLVRQLIEMHGGTVTASSPGVDRGSTFTVRLPLYVGPAESLAPAVAPISEPSTSPASRILVVDDNQDAADSLALLLEQWGHVVMTAANGEDGVTRAETFQPQIVFLDLGTPKMDGFEAAMRLRALPVGGQTTLIALTGWGQARDLERTHASGFDHHLLKPIDPNALRKLLARAD